MLAPAKIQNQYQQMLANGSALDLQNRLIQKDLTLWSCDVEVQQAINNRLGWLDCIDSMLLQVDSILEITQGIYDKGFRHCVLLGMGGSSLAPELFSNIFSSSKNENSLNLEVADNTSPDVIEKIINSIDLNQTLFIVASKSGTTIESDSLCRFFYKQLVTAGASDPGQSFIAITDADTPLAKLANDKNFLHCFVNPADIGGRFSVLSCFGLVPAALLGIDIVQLLTSAKKELTRCQSDQLVSEATKLGIILGLAAETKSDKIQIELTPELKPFAAWLEQLIAESSGKSGKGILPLIETFTNKVQNPAVNFQVTLMDRLSRQCQPLLSQNFNKQQIGAEFFKWEWAIAIAGSVMQINPFDEPNVGENKAITIQQLRLLNSKKVKDARTERSNSVVLNSKSKSILIDAIKRLIRSIEATDYLAILVYGLVTDDTESVLQNYRNKLKNKLGILSTFGIGPRYLHSTGQLHKGGANNGVFLIITFGPEKDLEIPGEDYSFAQLNHAQAMGDIQALEENGRRLLHIHADTANENNFQALAEILHATVQ